MANRKYLPTFAELIDRMTICQLKSIFIPENKEAYDKEISDIKHDIDEIIKEKDVDLTAELIRAISIVMLSNRYIWENESKVRSSADNNEAQLLKLTHSINGVRNTAKNVISNELGERVDLKTDCLAAELKSDLQNWDIFKNEN
jgi:PAB1-binding protein PBP1|tara:strand:+ start:3925 stop:4356 length:432 start_codon:yes stop_codon:yes gene_type:complete